VFLGGFLGGDVYRQQRDLGILNDRPGVKAQDVVAGLGCGRGQDPPRCDLLNAHDLHGRDRPDVNIEAIAYRLLLPAADERAEGDEGAKVSRHGA